MSRWDSLRRSSLLSKCVNYIYKWCKNEHLQIHFPRILTIFPERLHFQRGFLSNGYFCRRPLTCCSCFLYSMWIRNSKYCTQFFNTFICLHPTVTNVVIYWRIPVRLMMLHCIGMWILLSCDYAVSSFRSIFTLYINKSYNNTVRYWCHLKN